MPSGGPAIARLAACAFALAGPAACGVQLGGGGGTDAGQDSARPPDAQVDAAPCVGGDAAMRAPGGACFVLFIGPATYPNAQAGCASRGSRLAVLRSAQDDQVARTLAGLSDVFIGLTDLANEGSWVWPDGTGATYTNWYMNEPNDGGGTYAEDCAVVNGVRGGSWDDRPCEPLPTGGGGNYAYLCES